MPINLSTNLVLDSSGNRADGVYLDTVKKVVGAWYTADNRTEVMSLTGSANERNLLLPGQIFYVKDTNEMLIYSRSGNFPIYQHFFNQFVWPGSGGSAATGSLLTTASLAGSDLTFTKGNGDQFTLTLPSGGSGFPFDGDAVITGSLLVSGSGFTVTGSSNFDGIINASSVTSSFKGDLTGTASVATTAINANSASYVATADRTSIWNVTAGGGVYKFAGNGFTGIEDAPVLYLTRGEKYRFSVNASTHPFYIQTSAGAYNAGNVYNDGITNAGTQNGNVDWNVQFDAPTKLYYVCGVHSGMGNAIYIQDPNNATGSFSGSFTGDLTGTASVATDAISASYVQSSNVYGPFGANSVISASYALSASVEIIKEVSSSHADTASLALKNLSTASVSLNTITFTKGDGTTFPITVDTGSDESGIFKQTGSFFATSNDLQVTGSITSSFKGDLTGTASLATDAISASVATTAINATNATSASYIIGGNVSGEVTSSISASYIQSSNVYGPLGANSVVSASYALSASVEIIKEVSSSHAEVADVADGLQNNPSIAVTNITASGPISSSEALFISASESSTVDKVALYNDTTGQLFYTASSALGGGATIKATGSGLDGGSPGGDVSTITIQDYDTNVVVQYNAGDLKFIFGEPTAPTPSIAQSGFQSDRFNLQLQTYTITGTFGLGGYSLVSASLFSGSDQLETGTTGTSLSRTFTNVTGEIAEKTYSLQLTSSNPVTSAEDRQLETVALNLNKINPGSPSNTFNVDAIYLGAASNQIEVGATGSIAFTGSKSGTDNNWTFVSMSASPSTDPTITSTATSISASYNISASGVDSSISFFTTANYNSAALNNPVINANRNSSTRTYSRIRSLRFGAFAESATASLEAAMTDLGAFQAGGTIYKGTVNPNNQSVTMAHGSGVIEYIVMDDAYTLTEAVAGGVNQLAGTFTHTVAGGSPQVINGYRVYKSKTPLGATSGITYLLKT